MYRMNQNNRQARLCFEKHIPCEQRRNQPQSRFLVQTFLERQKVKKYANSRRMQLGTFSYKLTLITYSVCLFFFFFGAVSEAGDHKVGRDHLR